MFNKLKLRDSSLDGVRFKLSTVITKETREKLDNPECFLSTEQLNLLDPSRGLYLRYSVSNISHVCLDKKREKKFFSRLVSVVRIQLTNGEHVLLGFRHDSDQSVFIQKLEQYIRQHKQKKTNETSQTSPKGVGVAGIMQTRKEQVQQREEQLQNAFKDLESLMSQVKGLVELAQKYQGSLLESKVGEDMKEVVEFRNMAASLGVENPVTRAQLGGHGNEFHRQLAMEVYRTIEKPLRKNGGMMNLIDVYCWLIRARTTTELVSPDDLLAACEMFGKLHIPIHLSRLESGVIILEAGFMNDDEIAKKILEIVQSKASLNAVEYASLVNIPLLRAVSRLEFCEQMGFLCRDEFEENIRFFPNLYF
ncbi:ESCRT-II complex subunit VPS36 [Galdieria sulphuraria]|uniref:Vacuolar protein-sorting-associated protein 36 n=1 Tax=Galdieria sulphuraria TaxID=130081 RepID=M2X8A6_GALSU|nr:ESCRT-II complex subunit VPS36 [Galdieria sulphuraria]EME32790.1 ESCRT-II complex subunit VPS36 [Galdieria sulphuraria]|eukprot:XP_005709310.1 ESCRT-II complex subunit VPS36 [Galdieria sulphuraria]